MNVSAPLLVAYFLRYFEKNWQLPYALTWATTTLEAVYSTTTGLYSSKF
ncbi:hypothetical protein T11_14793 [Trichinella zimbabwensis]|uniref:Uncharacterized protein n=1 Tax=Trichinella zimbabwensis TaxID=268475 RepID=A0A0V1G716_9BILA|nr:hypothetical protein T11_14793 [Trichinella zimbabwensis]